MKKPAPGEKSPGAGSLYHETDPCQSAASAARSNWSIRYSASGKCAMI